MFQNEMLVRRRSNNCIKKPPKAWACISCVLRNLCCARGWGRETRKGPGCAQVVAAHTGRPQPLSRACVLEASKRGEGRPILCPIFARGHAVQVKFQPGSLQLAHMCPTASKKPASLNAFTSCVSMLVARRKGSPQPSALACRPHWVTSEARYARGLATHKPPAFNLLRGHHKLQDRPLPQLQRQDQP